MKKLKITLIIATIAIGLAITLILHLNSQAKMRENDAVLRQQDKQLTGLIAEQERLSNRIAEAKSSTNSQWSELTKLRNKAQALQEQTNKLGIQVKSNRQLRAAQRAVAAEPRPPEYYKELLRSAGAKPIDGRNLSNGFPLNGTNTFDIIYHGSLDELKGIPRGSVAVIRERQPWIAPSGKQARVYGMANGSSEIIEWDDDFKGWVAEHRPPSARDIV